MKGKKRNGRWAERTTPAERLELYEKVKAFRLERGESLQNENGVPDMDTLIAKAKRELEDA